MADELIVSAGLESVNQVDALAFDAGPGGFTGLRIAAALVQGLAYAGRQPVAGISALEALAWQLTADGSQIVGQCFACVIDARMNEVYWQLFEVTEASSRGLSFLPLCEAQLSSPEACLLRCATEQVAVFIGDYLFPKSSLTANVRIVSDQPRAESIALLAQCAPDLASNDLPAAAIPTYLRGASAWKKTSHKTRVDG